MSALSNLTDNQWCLDRKALAVFIDHETRMEAVEAGTGDTGLKKINLGTDWSSGDLIGARVAVPPAAHKLDLRDGTSGSPVKIGVTASMSRTDATTRAELNAMGPEGTDGPDGATIVRLSNKGTAASEVQISCLVASAWQQGAFASSGADAGPVLALARVSGSATGRAIPVYAESTIETSTARGGQGVEVRIKNLSGEEHTYVANGPSKSMGVWINSQSGQGSAGVQIGHNNAQQLDVGYGVNEGAVKSAAFRDDSEAEVGLDFKKPHSVAAVRLAASAGAVLIGANALSGEAPPQLLEINTGATSRSPSVKLTATSTASQQLQLNNPAGNLNIGQAGAVGSFVEGTAAGDGVITTGAKVVHIGQGTKRMMVRVSNNLALGITAADSFGSGKGVIFIANAETAPSANPTGGGILYTEAGKLMYRGSGGTTKELATA